MTDAQGPLRDRQRRHALPRRDRRDDAADAGPSCSASLQEREFERVGGNDADQGRRPRHRRHQPRPRRRGRRGAVPRGPLLPAQRRHIDMPPLRERRDDIPRLVEHFLRKCRRRGRCRPELTSPRRARAPRRARLARQRPRARERDRACGRALARQPDHRRPPRLRRPSRARTGRCRRQRRLDTDD